MPSLDFDPKSDVPDLSGKVILITGGTAGLGASAARTFAAHKPAHVFLSGRNEAAATKLMSSLSTTYPDTTFTFLACDLTSLASVRDAAQRYVATAPRGSDGGPRLDVLLCNAGIMNVPARLTTDGYEVQFGTNHVGHALLIKLLLPTLQATSKAGGEATRCVLVSSMGYAAHPMGGVALDDLRDLRGGCGNYDWIGFGGSVRYGQSKLANVLYAAELARRVPAPEVVFASIHPGVINTDLIETLSFGHRMFTKFTTIGQKLTEEEGGWNSVWACTAPVESGDSTGKKCDKGTGVQKSLRNGEMYMPVGKHHSPMRLGGDKELAKKLWEWTETELKDWTL